MSGPWTYCSKTLYTCSPGVCPLLINTSAWALAAPQLELNECKQPLLGRRRMSGVMAGGELEIDGNTDGGAKENTHFSLLSPL